ncbi:hypothetical protein ACJBX5_10620, partial [Streptococcus suis]
QASTRINHLRTAWDFWAAFNLVLGYMILFNGFLIILFIIVLVGCPGTQVADVIFLVQCTSRIGIQEFENIKTFLISVVNSTQVADNL